MPTPRDQQNPEGSYDSQIAHGASKCA
jgi:hypothetical protein